jgi:hypothetical protein
MEDAALRSWSSTLATFLMLLGMGLFFLGLAGFAFRRARKEWESGRATGSASQPLVANRETNPGPFAFLIGVRGFTAMLYAVGIVLSAATRVPL